MNFNAGQSDDRAASADIRQMLSFGLLSRLTERPRSITQESPVIAMDFEMMIAIKPRERL